MFLLNIFELIDSLNILQTSFCNRHTLRTIQTVATEGQELVYATAVRKRPKAYKSGRRFRKVAEVSGT